VASDRQVRRERRGDIPAIRTVNERAFGGTDEAAVVAALRAAGAVTLSLVAEQDGEVVGHVLFSPVTVETPAGAREAVGLGPMAVLPERQGRGLGSVLVREGLAFLARAGHGVVVVLGQPGYYPRFGFAPAGRFGLRCAFDCPDEAFMALELRPGALAALGGGVVRYHEAFGAA